MSFVRNFFSQLGALSTALSAVQFSSNSALLEPSEKKKTPKFSAEGKGPVVFDAAYDNDAIQPTYIGGIESITSNHVRCPGTIRGINDLQRDVYVPENQADQCLNTRLWLMGKVAIAHLERKQSNDYPYSNADVYEDKREKGLQFVGRFSDLNWIQRRRYVILAPCGDFGEPDKGSSEWRGSFVANPQNDNVCSQFFLHYNSFVSGAPSSPSIL